MAKLEGVKILDMVGGEITKVEYNGAVYEKVEGKAQLGDLLLIVDAYKDTTEGSFYQALPYTDHIGYIEFKDDVGDVQTRDVSSGYFVPFRKVGAPSIESVNAKEDALAERVDALEKGGSKPRTVKRKARVGERILVTDAKFTKGNYDNGDVRTVTETTGVGVLVEEHSVGLYHGEYEVIVVDKPRTFEVGDSVRALVSGEYGDVKRNEIGKVRFILDREEDDPYSIRVDTDGDCDYFRPQDLELVGGRSYKPTKGDIVVITANTNYSRNKVGDIGKVDRIEDDLARVDVPNRPSKASDYGNWTLFSEMRPATDEEKERYEQAVKWAKYGRQPNELKKGDIVRTKLYGLLEVKSIDEGNSHPIRVTIEGMSVGMMAESCELVAPVEARVDR